jgi:hypothetical protein
MTKPRSILFSSRRSLWRSSLCVAMATLWIGSSVLPVSAAVFTANINPAMFGNLDQDNVPFMGGCACGPTSAVNSFVYLQNEAPHIYGNGQGLVPYAGLAPTQAEQAAVATTLQGAGYMDANGGTYIEDFIFGKVKYLEDNYPGKTRYAAQVALDWRSGPRPVGTTDWPSHAAEHPQPSWVQDETAATLDFIYEQINAREDVEIFIGGGVGAHYLTVTGISYDDATNLGTLSYIDPADGMAHASAILGLDMGRIRFNYNGSNNALVFHAVSESPVPEPATIALMLIGLIGLCAVRRHAIFRDGSQK